jgi:hypothetical protein
MVHEAHEHEHNCFITLTYDPEQLPWGGTLVVEHFQKFMKRLRKHFRPKRIKYYHCGEYGEQLQRPHYHACLFGLDFGDKEPFKVTPAGTIFTSETLTRLWPLGFSTIAPFSWETAGYTAGYTMKKITGEPAQAHYQRPVISRHGEYLGEIQLLPEYATMSKGLGTAFYEKYKADFLKDDCPVPGRTAKIYKRIPRFYEKLMEADDATALETLKQNRESYALENQEEFTPERLMAKYKVKKAQLAQHQRGYENDT